MEHAPVIDDGVSAPLTRRLLPLGGRRPRPSFADSLAAGGGVIVAIGVLLIALDMTGNGDDGWKGALLFTGLLAVALTVMFVAPRAVRPGCTSAVVLSVPAAYGFLVLPSADSFGDVRVFFVLTIATWCLLFVVSNAKGRPILIGLAAALLYVWMLGEVADTSAYVSAPVPAASHATPTAPLADARGIDAQAAALVQQQITLDDLDETDPLYPLAEACDSGDLSACDDLWSQAEFDSDFEAFAESCGGDASATFPCNASSDLDVDINPLQTDPLDATPLGTQGDHALEIGLVSLLFGAAYLAIVRILDRRAATALATAFVLPGAVALVTAAAALGNASDSAVLGGLLTFASGVAIGVVGFFGPDRRFSVWGGGAVASIGALIVAADVAPGSPSSGSDADLAGTGIVVLLFGLVVIALGWLAYRALEPPPAPLPPPPPEPTDPFAGAARG
jgi:hypothetical protein